MFYKLKSKLSQFWIIQILGWGGWWFLSVFFIILSCHDSVGRAEHIQFKTARAIIGFGLCLVLIYIYHYFRKQSWSTLLTTVFAIVLSYIFGLVWAVLGELFYQSVWKAGVLNLKWYKFLKHSFDYAIVFMAWSALYFLIQHSKELHKQKENMLKATSLANQSQLQMLRYQLNPHFLFNALNSIRAMIDEDKQRARLMITELSEFLRFSLINGNKTITIESEINAIENYLDIEKIRFESRLEVSIDLDQNAKMVEIPGFLIHPLVENAIKYGMQTSEMPLKIRIRVYIENNTLCIFVTNTGQIKPKKQYPDKAGTGTGIKNIKERLDLMYPDQYKFDFYEKNNWVNAIIKINLENHI